MDRSWVTVGAAPDGFQSGVLKLSVDRPVKDLMQPFCVVCFFG